MMEVRGRRTSAPAQEVADGTLTVPPESTNLSGGAGTRSSGTRPCAATPIRPRQRGRASIGTAPGTTATLRSSASQRHPLDELLPVRLHPHEVHPGRRLAASTRATPAHLVPAGRVAALRQHRHLAPLE